MTKGKKSFAMPRHIITIVHYNTTYINVVLYNIYLDIAFEGHSIAEGLYLLSALYSSCNLDVVTY